MFFFPLLRKPFHILDVFKLNKISRKLILKKKEHTLQSSKNHDPVVRTMTGKMQDRYAYTYMCNPLRRSALPGPSTCNRELSQISLHGMIIEAKDTCAFELTQKKAKHHRLCDFKKKTVRNGQKGKG